MLKHQVTGILRKLKSIYDEPIQYYARIGDRAIFLNPFIGKPITLSYSGRIYCIQCARKTNKSFQQGFCFPCLRRLQECGLCIIYPERCKVEQGVCPKNDWAHLQCHVSHVVYLANSSGLKVGITREGQLPTRWIDQGALQAFPLFYTSNRYQAGIMEVALKAYVSDRTNWRVMLKNEAPLLDLAEARTDLLLKAKQSIAVVVEKFAKNHIRLLDPVSITSLNYPVLSYPEKIKTLSFETNAVEGRLLGIKGQYLILDSGVINIRKFSGYEVTLSLNEY